MTAPTTARSAYPRAVEDLIPHARDLAAQLGELPSRNKLMKTFRVGSDKANALILALAPAPAAPVSADPEPVEPPPGAEPVIEPVAELAPPLEPPAVIADEMPASRGITRPPAEPLAPYAGSGTLPKPDDILADAEILRGPWPVEPPAAEPVAEPSPKRRRPVVWPVLILCLPAFVAIWGGWVEMGRLTGFGMVTLLPGISDFQINTAITLPIGVETYAAYALYVWLSGWAVGAARRFAKWSALASLALGALGQIAYHLMAAAGWTSAPWAITAAVSCIPVAVLGMGAGLAHLMHKN